MMDQDPQVVRPQPTRMDDLAWNPRLLQQWEEQERKELERQKRLARRQALASQKPRPTDAPQTQTHLPQMSAAQRRANQADQPREHDGKYAEKKASKWRSFLTGEPAPRTSLSRVKHPARPGMRAQRPVQKKRPRPLPPVEEMMDRNPIAKLHWWITRGFRRWRRRKARQIRKALSLRG
jgi:hypothetical protein